MAKSKASVARSARANAVKAFSPKSAVIRSEWKWASRDVVDPRVAAIDRMLGEVDHLTFTLAQDIDSGRVELDLPDEPRPLFDRPKAGPHHGDSPRMDPSLVAELLESCGPKPDESPKRLGAAVQFPPGTTIPFPAGTKLFQCSRCNLIRRPEDGHPCGHCKNPEFGLVTVAEGDSLAEGWPEDEPDKPKPKRPRKAKVQREEIIAAEQEQEDAERRSIDEHPKDWQKRSVFCLDLNAVVCKKLIHFGFETIGHLAHALNHGKGPQIGSALGDKSLVERANVAVLAYLADENPPPTVAEIAAGSFPEPDDEPAQLHPYGVFLPADGETEREWIGNVQAPDLASSKLAAHRRFAEDYIPGVELEVEPADDRIGPQQGSLRQLVAVAECLTCGERWPKAEGVGCPRCVHGPIPDLAPIAADAIPPQSEDPPLQTFEVLDRGPKYPGHIQFSARDLTEAREHARVNWPGLDVRPVPPERDLANQKGSDGRPKTLPETRGPVKRPHGEAPKTRISSGGFEVLDRPPAGPEPDAYLKGKIDSLEAVRQANAAKKPRKRGSSNWFVIDDARDVDLGTIEPPSKSAAMAVAEGRYPGLRHLRVERKEATVADA